MPGRPRRQYFNRASAAVAALVTCAIGFYAGVRVEKSQVSSSSTAAGGAASAFAARARAFASGAAGGTAGAAAAGSSAAGSASPTGAGAGAASGARAPGAGGFGGASFGTVSSVRGGTMYVTESSGNTVKVKLSSSTKISKSLSVPKKAIRPGDTVVIQGLAGKNGTVTAASVSDSGTGSSGIRGLFGGGGSRRQSGRLRAAPAAQRLAAPAARASARSSLPAAAVDRRAHPASKGST